MLSNYFWVIFSYVENIWGWGVGWLKGDPCSLNDILRILFFGGFFFFFLDVCS